MSSLNCSPEHILWIEESDLEVISKSIDEHIKLEADMINEALDLLERSDDPKFKLIISAILEDEGEHHKLLKKIKEEIA